MEMSAVKKTKMKKSRKRVIRNVGVRGSLSIKLDCEVGGLMEMKTFEQILKGDKRLDHAEI